MARHRLLFWIRFSSSICWSILNPLMPSKNPGLFLSDFLLNMCVFRLILQVDNTWVTHMAEFIIDRISTNMVRLTMELELSCKAIKNTIRSRYGELYSWNSSAQFQYRWPLCHGWDSIELVSALRSWKLLVTFLPFFKWSRLIIITY